VGGIVSKVKRWLGGSRSSLTAAVAFTVECACGRSVEGLRQATHQVVPCPHCGARVFVLPRSPLPLVLRAAPKAPRAVSAASLRRWPWRLVGGIALGLAAVVGLVWWLVHGNSDPPQSRGAQMEEVGPYLKRAETALALGHARTARMALEQALALQEHQPSSRAERRRLTQLHRQAALGADLLEVPLQDVVRHADDLPHAEWQAVFRERFRGRSVILDAEVSRDAAGKYKLDYQLVVAGKEARVEIADLDLLRALRLDQPQRLIFGFRLAGLERIGNGPWVIRLQGDSGVLLTHRGLLEALCPVLRTDRETGEVLKRQARWLDETGS
jgi:DNA-directed RNA polymerase subunit RPC12/RpoP